MGSKQKFLAVKDILWEKTDQSHAMTVDDILSEMMVRGFTLERKTFYRYIRELEKMGIRVCKYRKGRQSYYHVVKRDFSLAELKLLVDAIQSSKFITQDKSQILIEKIERLTSEEEAKELNRQVYVYGRIKSMNDSIYNVIDVVHSAIIGHKVLHFQYFNWNPKKKMEYRHDGKEYVVYPWSLIWSDEYYYLVAYDKDAEKIKHFRADKIAAAYVEDNIYPEVEWPFRGNIAEYAKTHFGMFGGERKRVKIIASNDKAGVFIDRFGKEIYMKPVNDNQFVVEVNVAVSNMFIGWILGLGSGVKIIGPQDVVDRVKEEAERIYKDYLA